MWSFWPGGVSTLFTIWVDVLRSPLLVGLTLISDFSKELEIEDVFLAHYPYKRKRNNKDDTISLDFKIILVGSYY